MEFRADSISWLPEALRSGIGETLLVIALIAVVVLVIDQIGRRYVLRLIHNILERSPMKWDDLLVEHKVLLRAFPIIPLVVLQVAAPVVPGLSDGFLGFVLRLLDATMVLVVARTIAALFSVFLSFYERTPSNRRPIKSYVQLATVFLYVVAGIFMVARLIDQSPWYFISGLGAMMAIITLVFRDTLLSLVAGVQLTNNDLLRVGDWIEMPQFNADGFVIDIALNTVSVQNWDKTITVVPTHKFLEHSFKNWRGMQESGGRRIKRSLYVNMASIRFLTDEEADRFSRFALLKDYIREKQYELETYNAAYADDPEAIVNARRLTNIGTFRAYITNYLRSHPSIHQDLTFLVRQLQPTAEGVPIEIYVFVNDVRWVIYEGVQADIFDHLLAIAPEFGLHIYQRPSSYDLEAVRAEV